MKKFFSLVLALVMALSLTTVAWGATTVSDLGGLQTAVAAGGDIVLDADITGNVVITKGVTLDLAGNTIYGEVEINTTEAVLITSSVAGGAIINSAANGRCIDVRAGVNLTVENISITADCADKNNQPVTISADDAGTDTATVVLNNCVIDAGDWGYGVIVFRPTALTISDCEISGWAAVYMKPSAAEGGYSVGSSGSVVKIEGSQLNGYGHEGQTNAFATIAVEEDDVIINISADSTLTSGGPSHANFHLGSVVVKSVADVEITVADGATLTGDILDVEADDADDSVAADNVAENSVTVPAAYAEKMASEGYVVTVDANGQVAPSAFSASAPAGGTALTTLYDMVTTDAAQTKTVNVTVTTYAAEAPYDADDSGLIDAANERGCVKHFVFSNLPGKYFVQVNTVGEADYTVYVAGTKTLLGHFNEVEDPYYYGTAVPFNNFGKNCEQFKYTPVAGTKYYIFQNVVFEAVEAGGEITLMVGNKLTAMDTVSGSFVEHIASYTYNDKFEVTAVKCGVCGKPATIVPNYASLPDDVTSYGGPINEKMYYFWPAAAAVVTPDTKVESAATFDAGIAMYVGMSVLAATGSAVVLKKREG